MRRANEPILAGFGIHVAKIAALRHGIDVARVIRAEAHIKAIAKKHLLPICVQNAAPLPLAAFTHPGAIVLHTAANLVGNAVVNVDVIKLPDRNVVAKHPLGTRITRDVQAAVRAKNDIIRIVWIDPERVVVGVGAGIHTLKRSTAIFTHRNAGIQVKNSIFILRINENIVVVKWTVANESIVRIYFAPIRATVGALVQIIFLRFHQCVNDIWFGRRNCQTKTPQIAFRQAVFAGALRPVFAPIERDVQTRARATGGKLPGIAIVFPHGNDEFLRI